MRMKMASYQKSVSFLVAGVVLLIWGTITCQGLRMISLEVSPEGPHMVNDSLNLTCKASIHLDSMMYFNWSYPGAQKFEDEPVLDGNKGKSTLLVRNAEKMNEGTYRCSAYEITENDQTLEDYLEVNVTVEEPNPAEDTSTIAASDEDPDTRSTTNLSVLSSPQGEAVTENDTNITLLPSLNSDDDDVDDGAGFNQTDDLEMSSDDGDTISPSTETIQRRNGEISSTSPSNNHTTLHNEDEVDLQSSLPSWDTNKTLSTLSTESTTISSLHLTEKEVIAEESQLLVDNSSSLSVLPSSDSQPYEYNSTADEINEYLVNDTNDFPNVSDTTDLRRDRILEETPQRPMSPTPTVFSSFFTIPPNWNKGREGKKVTDREIFENATNETMTDSVPLEKDILDSTSYSNVSVTANLHEDEQPSSQRDNQANSSQRATSPNSESSSFIIGEVEEEIKLPEEAEETVSTISPLPVPKYILLVLEKDCAGKSMFQNIFAVLNTHLLGVLSATGSDDANLNIVGCSTFIHLNYSIEGVADSAIDEAIRKLSENITLGEGFKVSKVFPNGEGYDTFRITSTAQPKLNVGDGPSNVLGHSEMIAYIIAGVSLGLLLFTIILCSCIRCICHKQTNSLDLCDIPHLNLKLEDYKLTPIPRPTISFPDYGRDLIMSEGYNTPYPSHPPRLEDTILTQHHFSGDSHSALTPALTTEVLSSYPQEMRTFGGKKSCSRIQSLDMKPSMRGSTNWMSSSRERLNSDFDRKNSGMENPGFRKWF